MNSDLKNRIESLSIPEPNSGCWLWLGSLSDTGYGRIGVDGRSLSAHRASFIAHNGEIPHSMCVLHKCDTRACVNPDHLFVGTHKDNALDMSRKKRGNLNKASRDDRSEWSKKAAATLGAQGRRAKALKIATKMTVDQIKDRSSRGGQGLRAAIARMSPEARQSWLASSKERMLAASAASANTSDRSKRERALKGWATRRSFDPSLPSMRINLIP